MRGVARGVGVSEAEVPWTALCTSAASWCFAPPQESIVIVEYPKKLAALVRPTLGPLEKLRDRRYGRTYLAIYGPPSAA